MHGQHGLSAFSLPERDCVILDTFNVLLQKIVLCLCGNRPVVDAVDQRVERFDFLRIVYRLRRVLLCFLDLLFQLANGIRIYRLFWVIRMYLWKLQTTWR